MLKELFSKNKNIVINTDIDGILSGILLNKYFNCNVVGFSNSKETVWLEPFLCESVYDPIYIDLYVVNPNVVCIEQHIIATDTNHLKKIKELGTKINPNLERGKYFTYDYFHKYPFGTVHFLIALMEAEGIKVELPDLNKLVKVVIDGGITSITLGQIILRADDALFSSLGPYAENARDWWKWLIDKSNNAESIRSLVSYVNNTNPNENQEIKQRTGIFFKKGFGCTGNDGAFDNICDIDGNIIPDFEHYIEIINNIINGNLKCPNFYDVHRGEFKKRFVKGYQKEELKNLMEDPELFSYAFIYGPNSRYQNYSYTTNMI